MHEKINNSRIAVVWYIEIELDAKFDLLLDSDTSRYLTFQSSTSHPRSTSFDTQYLYRAYSNVLHSLIGLKLLMNCNLDISDLYTDTR